MPGSVAYLEWVSASRRGGHHRLRHVYLVVLTIELAIFGVQWLVRAYFQDTPGADSPREALMHLTGGYFELFGWQHVVFLLLITPSLASGSVTEEKTRGTLALLLTTPLLPGEIILGKALAGLGQVLLASLPVLPVMTFLTAVSGMAPATLLAWLVETLALGLVLTSVGLLASVLARTTTQAVLMTYGLIGLLAATVVRWGDPGWLPLLTPRQWRRQMAGEAALDAANLIGLLAAALLTVICLALACRWLRPGHERFLVAARPRFLRVFDRPHVGEQPLRWKENYAGHLAALVVLRRFPRPVKILALCLVPLALGAATLLRPEGVLYICLLLVLGPGVVIGIRSAAVIAGEREKQTWDSLLTTPLTVRQIVRGKLWGVIDGARPYLLPLLFVSMLMCGLCGGWFYVGAPIIAWAIGWGFLYFQAANGVYWSARCASSWQALLRANGAAVWTLVVRSYFAGIAGVFLASLCFVFFNFGTLGGAWLMPAGTQLVPVLVAGVGFFVPLVAALFSKAEELLEQTEKYLSERERTA